MKIYAGVIGSVIISLCYIVDAADTDTPTIGAHLGSDLNSSHVKEDNDIYITCDIEPNTTTVYKVKWYHDGKEVSTDFKAGIIIVDKNLVLQNIKNPTSGNYHCEAITDKGALKSDPIPIDVKNANEKPFSENNTTVSPSTEIPTTTVNPENSTDTNGLLEGRSDLNSDSENATSSSTQNTTTVPTIEAATTITPKNSTDTTSNPSERPGSSKDPKNVKSYFPSTTISGTTISETTTPGTTIPVPTTTASTASGSTTSGTTASLGSSTAPSTTPGTTTIGSIISRTTASGRTTTPRVTASRTTPSRSATSRTTTSRPTASGRTTSRTTASRTTPPKTTASRSTVPANTEIPTTAIPEPNSIGNRFDIPGFNQDFLNDRQPGQNFTKQFHHGDCNIQYDRSDRGDTHVTWKRGNDDIEMNVRPDGNIGQNWNFPGVQIRLIATSAGEKEQNWNLGPAQYILKQLPSGALATRWIVRSYSFGTPMIVEDWDTLNFYRNLISAWCDRFYFLVDERDQCIIY